MTAAETTAARRSAKTARVKKKAAKATPRPRNARNSQTARNAAKAAAADVKPMMSEAAVKAKTGKTFARWFALIDKARDAAARGSGGKGSTTRGSMTHKEIAAWLGDEHDVGPWWRQMVTVAYERARGLRQKHQTATGFQISKSVTLQAPIGEVFDAWRSAAKRSRWLADPGFTVRSATKNKYLRLTWIDGSTNVEVNFYPKESARGASKAAASKTQVSVQHNRLPDAKAGQRMKAYWAEQLGRLKEHLA